MGLSIEPTHKSTTSSVKVLITISSKFLQILVERKRAKTIWLKVINIEMTTLFGRSRLDLSRSRLDKRFFRELDC